MRVKLFTERADLGFVGLGAIWKGKRIEAAGFYIDRIVPDPEVASSG